MPEVEEIDRLIEKLNDRENYWNKTIEDMKKRLLCTAKEVIPLQAEVISMRQIVTEQIKEIAYSIFKLIPKINAAKKERFEYYAGPMSHVPNNATERMRLIEWDISTLDQKKNVLDQHVEFMKETLKNIDNFNFTIKNKIALYQMADLE